MQEHIAGLTDAIKSLDAERITRYTDEIALDEMRIEDALNAPVWETMETIPKYGDIIAEDISTVRSLMRILDKTQASVLRPLADLLTAYPASDIKPESGGINVKIIFSYLNFIESISPDLKGITQELNQIHLRSIHIDFREYTGKLTEYLDKLETLEMHKDLIQAVFGDGNDRTYLIMAQNTAEIRASGGFPGSMGLVTIRDGVLKIGDFSSVLNYLQRSNTEESGITDEEVSLFQSMYARWSHDACYNPHFAKVAHITKVAYENANDDVLDGIIALTPAIIQKVLALTDKEIVLDDGSILNGNNATRVIQRDLYYKYQGNNLTAVDNNEYIDRLFAETAKDAIGILFDSINLDNFEDYISFFEQCGEDRTMILWFDDPIAEALTTKYHCSGNLSSDPYNPVAGVYFSCCDPGKLGMFTAIDVTANLQKTYFNGAKEYSIRATFNNYVNTENVADMDSWYLFGSNGRAIQGYAYFFAPAGGKVEGFNCSNGMQITETTYENLEVGYILDMFLYPGQPVTVTYTLTTAPGSFVPLQIDKTPTLQNFR